jgi:hypothetical protein
MRISETTSFFGSLVKTGKVINLGKSSMSHFKKEGGIPYGYQCHIEKLTDGKLIADREHAPENIFYIPEEQAKAA